MAPPRKRNPILKCMVEGCPSDFTSGRDAQVHFEGIHELHFRYRCTEGDYCTADPTSIRRHQKSHHKYTLPGTHWTVHECLKHWGDYCERTSNTDHGATSFEEDAAWSIMVEGSDLISHDMNFSQNGDSSYSSDLRHEYAGHLIQSALHAPNQPFQYDAAFIRWVIDQGLSLEDMTASGGLPPTPICHTANNQSESSSLDSTTSLPSPTALSIEESRRGIRTGGSEQFAAVSRERLAPGCVRLNSSAGYRHLNTAKQTLVPGSSAGVSHSSVTADEFATVGGGRSNVINPSFTTGEHEGATNDYAAELARSANEHLKTFRGF